jgi:hypothetical protein
MCDKNYFSELENMMLKFWQGFRGHIEIAESASAITLGPRQRTIWNDYHLEYLCEFESIFEKALAHEYGPKEG